MYTLSRKAAGEPACASCELSPTSGANASRNAASASMLQYGALPSSCSVSLWLRSMLGVAEPSQATETRRQFFEYAGPLFVISPAASTVPVNEQRRLRIYVRAGGRGTLAVAVRHRSKRYCGEHRACIHRCSGIWNSVSFPRPPQRCRPDGV
jgi:hypothetical protein